MATPAPNESALVRRIVTALTREFPGIWVEKIHGSAYQTAGLPDLFVVLGGRFAGLEVKCPRPGESEEHARERATLRQRVQIERLRAAGAEAAVVVSVEEAVEVVKRLSESAE